MKPVAVCRNLLSRQKTSADDLDSYEQWLENNGIPWERIDCYHYGIIDQLSNYSALIWHYSNFVNADLMEAQHILDIASEMGLTVFPNHSTGWHFDDKIAEMYALQAAKAPIPNSWVFYELQACLKWLENDAKYPLVAKLRRGSGASNVKLLHSFSEAKKYAKRMFSSGYQPAPSVMYKTYSKVQSVRSASDFKNRFKKIPNFLKAHRFGKGMPIEKGYCYFQEFIENEGYDLKVAIVNGKCCAVTRGTRKGDFRASGGGDVYFKRELVTEQIILSAFAAAKNLKMQAVGFDYVVDKKTGEGKIIEMCFGNGVAKETLAVGGYWDESLTWHDKPLNVIDEVMSYLFKNNNANQ